MSGPSLEVVGLEVSGSEATSSPGLLWLGGEAVLRLGDVVVEAPMTYGSVGSVDVKEASCIYTRMTVNMEENASGLEMGYWPSYSAMKPHQRGYYLHWLASGKKTPPANIGYAFVYFYGLERRALLDGRDVFWILEEAKRLLELCGASRSFRGYLGRFLVYLHAKHLNDPRMTEKSLADLYRLLPASQGNMLSRLVLGHRALQNAPLSAEQAFNLLSRLPKTEKTRSFAPRFSSSPELKRLFALRYGRVYPQGFTLSASFGQKRKKNSASYSVASGTLSFAQGAKSPEPAAIPNVLGKASQFKKLQGIYDVCIEELAASKGRSASDEFVVARPAGKRLPGEPLPLVRIDMDKVAALKEETETLTRELAAVFDSGEPDEPGFTQTSSPSEDAEEETEVLPFPQEAVRQLDRRYRPCVSALLRQAAWRKEDLSALARRHSLMPNSMLDAVNTWSAETLGDFLLLEEEGAWTVNATVL